MFKWISGVLLGASGMMVWGGVVCEMRFASLNWPKSSPSVPIPISEYFLFKKPTYKKLTQLAKVISLAWSLISHILYFYGFSFNNVGDHLKYNP